MNMCAMHTYLPFQMTPILLCTQNVYGADKRDESHNAHLHAQSIDQIKMKQQQQQQKTKQVKINFIEIDR